METNAFDLIKFYQEKYGYKNKTGVSPEVFRKVIDEFNSYLVDRIIKGERVYLPYSIGYLEIQKRKQHFVFDEKGKVRKKTMMIDWKRTCDFWRKYPEKMSQGKVIYHTNEHSGEYRFFLKWKKQPKLRRMYLYSLLPSRRFKLKLANYIYNPESLINYSEKC